ncbi:MAG: 30S ribosomal protein S6 [FCB group bacterium]|nr:30S ribosomal protein S6 [FCB group bacterium]
MRYYESMIIIHPALETNRLKDLIVGIHENLKRKGGTVITTELWGRKRLAYLIDKQKYGTYLLLQFSGEKVRSTDFNTDLEHDADILAYMTVKIEKEQIREQETDLDTQIAGTAREEAQTQSSESDEKTEEKPEKSTAAAETTEEDTSDPAPGTGEETAEVPQEEIPAAPETPEADSGSEDSSETPDEKPED